MPKHAFIYFVLSANIKYMSHSFFLWLQILKYGYARKICE